MLGKLLSRYLHQYQRYLELGWDGNSHYGGSMQPTNGVGMGVCETSAQGFARHQVVGIATNGGML
jgi:hypothetical protein